MPARSSIQHAQRVKQQHADYKQRVRKNPPIIVQALDLPLTMYVDVLLMAQPGWGPARTWRVLEEVGIYSRRQINELTDRQRRLLQASVTTSLQEAQ